MGVDRGSCSGPDTLLAAAVVAALAPVLVALLPSPAGAAVELPTCQVGAVHVLGAAWGRQPSERSGMIEGLEPMTIEITMGSGCLHHPSPRR